MSIKLTLAILQPVVLNIQDNQNGKLMATLYEEIADKLFKKLADSKTMETERIEQLRVLLAGGKKPKADELAQIFSAPAGGDLK